MQFDGIKLSVSYTKYQRLLYVILILLSFRFFSYFYLQTFLKFKTTINSTDFYLKIEKKLLMILNNPPLREIMVLWFNKLEFPLPWFLTNCGVKFRWNWPKCDNLSLPIFKRQTISDNSCWLWINMSHCTCIVLL